jgi:hypothetical protein
VESLEERALLDGTSPAQEAEIDNLAVRNQGLAKLEAYDGLGEAVCKGYIQVGVIAREAIPGVGPVLKACRYAYNIVDWLFESVTPPEANMAAPIQGPDLNGLEMRPATVMSTVSPLATDTVIERMPSLLLDGPPETVPIELIGLSLVSAEPIIANDPEPQPQGTMTVPRTHCNGGTFQSTLPVSAKFSFSSVPGDYRY